MIQHLLLKRGDKVLTYNYPKMYAKSYILLSLCVRKLQLYLLTIFMRDMYIQPNPSKKVPKIEIDESTEGVSLARRQTHKEVSTSTSEKSVLLFFTKYLVTTLYFVNLQNLLILNIILDRIPCTSVTSNQSNEDMFLANSLISLFSWVRTE